MLAVLAALGAASAPTAEELAIRRAKIAAMEPSQKQVLLRRYERFSQLSPEEQERLRNLQTEISRDPKGNATAMVVTADGTVEPRTVVTSRAIGDQWLVESGLQAGDRMIVEGLQKVQPGGKANAVEQGAAPAPQDAADAANTDAAADAPSAG